MSHAFFVPESFKNHTELQCKITHNKNLIVMITSEQKIPIPNDPVELIELGVKIYAKHCIMGDKSPLLALKSNSWAENGSQVNNAMRLQELSKESIGIEKKCLCKRDELIIKIKASIQASHDLLSDMYGNDLDELGFWGFDTDNSLYTNDD